jgi:ribosome maturation factor RimP
LRHVSLNDTQPSILSSLRGGPQAHLFSFTQGNAPFIQHMSRHNPILTRTFALIEPVCHSAGYELVDMRFTMEHGGWTLRVCIDLLPVDNIQFDLSQPIAKVDTSDCERASREISAVLDVEDPIPQAYSLEVSSPGIDRPLRTKAHFQMFAGAETRLTMAVPHTTSQGTERRNFKGIIEGTSGVGAGAMVQLKVDGVSYSLRIEDIDQARLVPDWDEVMRGKSGVLKPEQPDKATKSNKAGVAGKSGGNAKKKTAPPTGLES